MAVTASFQADFSKWITGIQQVNGSLDQLRQVTGVTETSFERMVSRFDGSKVMREAVSMVDAVDKLGGAARLTDTEAAKINRTVSEAIEKMQRLGGTAPPEMLKLRDATERAGESTESLGTRLTGLFTALNTAKQAIDGVVNIASEWTKSYTEQENATVRLDTALRAQGSYTPELAARYAELASQFQKTTIYGDELLTEMQSLLVTVGNVMPQDMKRAMTAATDLASALRKDLPSATMMLSKALEGNMSALQKAGIKVDDLAFKTQGASAVFDAIADKMGGQATEAAKTFGGQVDSLNNSIDDVKEEIGAIVAEQLTALMGMFRELPESVQKATIAIGLMTGAAGAATIAVGALGGALNLLAPVLTGKLIGLLTQFGSSLAVSSSVAALGAGLASLAVGFKIASDDMEEFQAAQQRQIDISKDASLNMTELGRAAQAAAVASINATVAASGLNLALDDSGKIIPKASETVRKFDEGIAHLRKESLIPLTEEQKKSARAAYDMKVSVDEIAKAHGISEKAIQKYLDSVRQTETEQKKHAKALEEVRMSEMALSESTRAAILDLNNRKVSIGAIVAATGAHEIQIKRVIEAEKEASENAKISAKRELERAIEFRKTQEQITKGLSDIADKHVKVSIETFKAAKSAEDAIRLMSKTGLDRQLAEIEQAKQAELLAAREKYEVNSYFYKTIVKEIEMRYDFEERMAKGTADTIVERMNRAGVMTIEQQKTIAASLKATYEQMKASGLFSAKDVEEAKQKAEKAASDISSSFAKNFGEMMGTQLPQAIMGAIQGGGSVIEAVGSTIGSFLVSDNGIGKSLAAGVKNVFGNKLGGMIASALPALGAMIGPALSGLFNKLFGSAGRDAVKEFASTFGGFDALREKLNALGAEGERLWVQLTQGTGKNNKAQAEAAIRAIQEAFARAEEEARKLREEIAGIESELADLRSRSEPTFRDMEAAAKAFGVELSRLGPAFQQQRLTDRAREIYDAFDTLRRGGADTTVILEGMADEINDLVLQSLKFGTTIPENFRPLIQSLLESGQLVDENGEKLTDLGQIRFGDAVKSQWEVIADRIKDLTDALQKLVEKLNGPLVDAAKNVAREFGNLPGEIDVRLRVGRPGDAEGDELPQFATGTKGVTGRYFQNFGAGKLAMLHGNEAVVPQSQAQQFADAVGGGNGDVVAELSALRSDFVAMPRLIARAVRDAILVAG